MPQTERMFLRMDPSDRELIGLLRDRWGTGDESKTIRAAIRQAAELERSGGGGVPARLAPPAVAERAERAGPAAGGRAGQAGAGPSSLLDVPERLGVDLVAAARASALDRVVGRADELERQLALLVRLTRNSVVVVGERGVGKTALVEGLAARIAAGDVPEVLRHKEVVAVDGAELATVARCGGPAALARVEELVERGRSGAIVFVNRMGALVDAWRDGPAAVGRLRLALARGEVQAIGEMTPERHRRWAEEDELSGRFEVLTLAPAGKAEALEVLRALREDLERHHDVSLGEEVLAAAVSLSADGGLPQPRGAVVGHVSPPRSAGYPSGTRGRAQPRVGGKRGSGGWRGHGRTLGPYDRRPSCVSVHTSAGLRLCVGCR